MQNLLLLKNIVLIIFEAPNRLKLIIFNFDFALNLSGLEFVFLPAGQVAFDVPGIALVAFPLPTVVSLKHPVSRQQEHQAADAENCVHQLLAAPSFFGCWHGSLRN